MNELWEALKRREVDQPTETRSNFEHVIQVSLPRS